MAPEPRASSSNRLKWGSAHVNLDTLLGKEGSNTSTEIWPETPLYKQKTNNHQENLAEKQAKGLHSPVVYPIYVV